jgi:hypothetical protein
MASKSSPVSMSSGAGSSVGAKDSATVGVGDAGSAGVSAGVAVGGSSVGVGRAAEGAGEGADGVPGVWTGDAVGTAAGASVQAATSASATTVMTVRTAGRPVRNHGSGDARKSTTVPSAGSSDRGRAYG